MWMYQPLLPSAVLLNSVLVAKTASDSCAVQASEGTGSLVYGYHGDDTCVVRLNGAESGTFSKGPVSDSLTVGLTDAASLLSIISVADSLTAGLTDDINIGTARAIATTETLVVQLPTEAASILSTISVADSLVAGLTDTISTLVAVFSTTESLAVQLVEGAVTLAASVVASETVMAGLSDEINLGTARPIATDETLVVQLAPEAVAITVSASCTDSLVVQLDEAAVLSVTASCAESLAVIISEAAPNVIQNSLISTTDSLVAGLTEATPVIGLVFTVADDVAAGLTDAITGGRTITAEDSLAVQLSEAVTNSLNTVASESVTIGLQGAAAIAVSAVTDESLAVQLAEVGTQSEIGAATPKSASDSCAVQAGDTIEQVPFVGLFDDFARTDESPVSPVLWPSVIRAGDSVLRVVSQRLTAAASGDASAATAALLADSEILVTVVTKPFSGSDAITLHLRTTDPGFQPEGYAAIFRNTDVTIQRITEGVGTDLSAASYTLNNGDQLLFRVIGSRLSAYHKPSAGSWTLLTSATDGIYQTGGAAGIRLSQSANVIVLDDVAAGSVRVGVALAALSTVTDDGPHVVDSDIRFAPQEILTSDEMVSFVSDYTAGAFKEDAETYWNGWNGEERELVYADSYQTGRRENPSKMRW